jgi:hypothetical protein
LFQKGSLDIADAAQHPNGNTEANNRGDIAEEAQEFHPGTPPLADATIQHAEARDAPLA